MTEQGVPLPTKVEFSQQLGRKFRATSPEIPAFDLELVEFNEIADTEDQETFSLIFQTEPEVLPDQKMYTIENADLGAMDLFLVPVKKDQAGLYFEVVINRFKHSEQ